MKHAYLILAHKNWNQLMTLLSLLDDSHNDIFLHIDRYAADAPIEQLRASVKKAQLVFVKRIGCSWGDYSLVKAELELLKEATKAPHAYYHLLSGQDLPLKPQKEIRQFFEKNTGQEFVEFSNMIPEAFNRMKKRLCYYTFFQHSIGHAKKTGIFYFVMRRFQKLTVFIQKQLGVNRLKGMESQFYFGSQWFSITDAFARYVLSREAWIEKHFHLTTIPDEHFMQTLLMQSPFRGKVSPMHIRLINWKERSLRKKWGSPDDFTTDDYDLLRSSEYLFARKFDETVNAEIISMIRDDCLESE